MTGSSNPLAEKKKKGKKKRPAFQRRAAATHKPGYGMARPTFCERNLISESKYYDLKRQGKAPEEIEIDGRIMILEEGEAKWRAERAAETAKRRQQAEHAAGAAALTTSGNAEQEPPLSPLQLHPDQNDPSRFRPDG